MNDLYAKWGVLLGRILKETGGKKKDLHRAIVRAIGRRSLTELTNIELKSLIDEIVGYLASEHAIEVYFDKENAEAMEKMTLTELFKYYEGKN